MPLTQKRREELIEGLISNEEGIFDEDDADRLEELTDNQLVALSDADALDAVVNNAARYEQIENECDGHYDKMGKKKKSKAVAEEMVDEEDDEEEMTGNRHFNEEDLPEEILEDLQFARNMKQQQKDQYIAKIVANKNGLYTKDELSRKPLNELQKIASYAATTNSDASDKDTKKRPKRLGVHIPTSNADESDNLQDELLEEPVFNWESK